MPKPTVGLNLRVDPELYERVNRKKGDLPMTQLLDQLLRLYVAGEFEIREAEK